MSTSAASSDKHGTHCKKCDQVHDKPVGAKCSRVREDKPTSQEPSVSSKKTPKKNDDSSDKPMDVVLATMASFSEKLDSMEQRISSLASKSDQSSRKSRSREKTKRSETTSSTEDIHGITAPQQDIVMGADGGTFNRVFSDTAVAVKPSATPARPKKLKQDLDFVTLGDTTREEPIFGVTRLPRPTFTPNPGVFMQPKPVDEISQVTHAG